MLCMYPVPSAVVVATHITTPHVEQSVWLTSVGAAWGNPKKAERIDDAALPATADFDWVRVYEK